MIRKFEKFNDYTSELDQLEDIFSSIDLELDVSIVKSDIIYEVKDIPKLVILVEFQGKNELSNTFREINKRVILSESFGYGMSHARISLADALWPNLNDIEDCYGFENPLNWISEELEKDIQSINDFNEKCIIKFVQIYFNPQK